MGPEHVQVVTQKSTKFDTSKALQRLREFSTIMIFFVPVGADLVEYQFAQKSAQIKVHIYLNVI